MAVHKCAGYASHSANLFCSWCECTKGERSNLVLGKKRTKEHVLARAAAWAQAKTLKKQKDLVTSFGIRDSALNLLKYRNPVDHVPIGIMHNWLEGVLQHHFRYRWGFKGKAKIIMKTKRGALESEEDESSESEDERMAGSWDDDFDLKEGTDESLFSESELNDFRALLQNVVVPAGVESIPKNLGDVSHGKLKAAQWKSLFLYYIPLVILELQVLDVDDFPTLSTRHLIVRNIASLVQCTQIVLAKSVSEFGVDQFRKMYNVYGETSSKLFNDKRVLPNHHYALHIPEMMEYWGPLMGVSEFSGERVNGLLQKVKTNNLISESDI